MNNDTQVFRDDLARLVEDAQALLTATADVAEDKVSAARQRLAAALESGKHLYARVRDKAVEGAEAACETVKKHPYETIALGVGAGAVLGYLVARRCRCPRS